MKSHASPPAPGLAIIFRVLAVFELIGGLVIWYSLRPGEAALIWLMIGLISGCSFLAIANVLIYLSRISNSLAQIIRDYNSFREEPPPPPLQLTPEDLK